MLCNSSSRSNSRSAFRKKVGQVLAHCARGLGTQNIIGRELLHSCQTRHSGAALQRSCYESTTNFPAQVCLCDFLVDSLFPIQSCSKRRSDLSCMAKTLPSRAAEYCHQELQGKGFCFTQFTASGVTIERTCHEAKVAFLLAWHSKALKTMSSCLMFYELTRLLVGRFSLNIMASSSQHMVCSRQTFACNIHKPTFEMIIYP